MKERIQRILNHYGLTAAGFAKIIGVQPSSVSHIISERNKPSLEFLQKVLASYPEINALWLISGEGSFTNSLRSQSTLFDEIEPKKQKTKVVSKFTKKTTPLESNIQNSIEPLLEINPEKQVEKVIIFYSDKTFSSYSNGN